MKILVTFFALVGFIGVLGTTPTLKTAWTLGANTVPAPAPELFADGTVLKTEVIEAMGKYLEDLDKEIDRQVSSSAYGVLQPCNLAVIDIIKKQILVNNGLAGPTEFDNELTTLTFNLQDVLGVVNSGERSLEPKVPIRFESLQRSIPRFVDSIIATFKAKAVTRSYLADDLFFNYENAVLQRDFEILRKWLLNTFNNGYTSIVGNSKLMEKNYRLTTLWQMVQILQDDVKSIMVYDIALKKYSTASIWNSYDTVRAQFLSIDVEKKILEDS